LRFLDGEAAGWRALSSQAILLTSLMHVNPPGAEIKPQRIQNGALGGFLSNACAL